MKNRMRGWTLKPDRWLQLRDRLEIAKKQGLPADKLLVSGFDLTRNKFDHGDIFPFIPGNTRLASVGGTPDVAVEQLKLAHDFLIALYSRKQPRVSP